MPILLKMKQAHWKTMQHHVSAQSPLEACGLLAGKGDTVESVLPIRNQAQSPVRFRMDPIEQLRAFEWMDANDLDLVGIFHSHPTGPGTASITDMSEAAYSVIHIIWAQTGDNWNARGFWIENGLSTEVPLQVVDR